MGSHGQFQLMEQVDTEVLDCFLFYATLSVIKLISASLLTSKNRMKNKVFPMPEDAPGLPMKSHPDVERAIRVHMNDFENIVPFFFLGLFFSMTTGPRVPVFWAKMIFRVFFCSRLGMSICQYYEIQPWRSLLWFIAFCCNATLLYFICERVGMTTKFF